jgi:hypothetical protein
MKKWITGILILLIAILAWIYLFIPNSVSVRHTETFEANDKASFRTLLDINAWNTWWPGEKKLQDGKRYFYYHGYIYTIIDQKINALVIAIANDHMQATTTLNFFSDKNGEVVLFWEGVVPSTLMPVSRVQNYFNAKSIQHDMEIILQKIRDYLSKDEHIYQVPIREEKVKDSLLISTYDTSKGYPSTAFIYNMIDQLITYAGSHKTSVTGLPMLNISTQDSVNFLTRVALPVDQKLPSSGRISYKWMLGGGNILVSEIKGGPYSINNAISQMELYIEEHRRTAPAIPFQSLVTDRSKEADTSKWVTRIYYPVM